MIDLHSHILPNMDDGSKSPAETAALLARLGQQGITTLAATPHFYAQEAPDVFLRRRKEATENMPVLPEGAPEILLGAEVAYFPSMGNCDALIPLQIGDWSDRVVEDVCEIPVQLGLIPVLAHVNRYPGRKQFPKYKDILMNSGVFFQCNAEAFLTPKTRRWALDLMKKGYIHFLGSDCHNTTTRFPRWDEAKAVIAKKLGPGFLENLDQNARELLESK